MSKLNEHTAGTGARVTVAAVALVLFILSGCEPPTTTRPELGEFTGTVTELDLAREFETFPFVRSETDLNRSEQEWRGDVNHMLGRERTAAERAMDNWIRTGTDEGNDPVTNWLRDQTVTVQTSQENQGLMASFSHDGRWYAGWSREQTATGERWTLILQDERVPRDGMQLVLTSVSSDWLSGDEVLTLLRRSPRACWSPSGGVLAASYFDLEAERHVIDLFVMPRYQSAEGRGVVRWYRVSPEDLDAFQPTFSPRQNRFAYVTWDGVASRVRVVELSTWVERDASLVSTSTFSPNFHPMGYSLVYVVDRGTSYGLTLEKVVSMVPKSLQLGMKSPYVLPSFSPDGESVAYYDDSAIRSVSTREVGRDPDVLVADAVPPGKNRFITRIQWLPNSTQVLYAYREVTGEALFHSNPENAHKGNRLLALDDIVFGSEGGRIGAITRAGNTYYYSAFVEGQWRLESISLKPHASPAEFVFLPGRYTGKGRILTTERDEYEMISINSSDRNKKMRFAEVVWNENGESVGDTVTVGQHETREIANTQRSFMKVGGATIHSSNEIIDKKRIVLKMKPEYKNKLLDSLIVVSFPIVGGLGPGLPNDRR